MRHWPAIACCGLAIVAWAGCNQKDEGDWNPNTAPAYYLTTDADLGAKTPKKPYKLVLIAKEQDHPFYKEMTDAARKTAEALKVELTVNSADTAQAQDDLIRQAVAAKPDAILLVPVDCKQVVGALSEAIGQKIPVIDLSDTVSGVALKKQNLSLAGTVTSDYIRAGSRHGVAFYQGMKDRNGGGTFMQIRSTTRTTTGTERADGFQSANHPFPDMKITVDQPVEETAAVKPLVQKAVADHANLRGILTTDDILGLAAREALGDKKLPVYSYGGGKAAVEAVKSGKLDGTIDCHPEKIGDAGVRMAVGILNGELKTPSRLNILPDLVLRGQDGKIEIKPLSLAR